MGYCAAILPKKATQVIMPVIKAEPGFFEV